jgi:hypothetical protein
VKLQITQQGGIYHINIEKPCCDDMGAALQKQFIVFWNRQANQPPVIAFKAPGEMFQFGFCPWCSEQIESQRVSDLMIPPSPKASLDLRRSREKA